MVFLPECVTRLPVSHHFLRRSLSSPSRAGGAPTRRNRARKVLTTETITLDGNYSLPTFVYRPSGANAMSEARTNAAFSNLPPLLLVSGWTGVASDWGAIPSMLASQIGRDVVTFDARGVGDSTPVDVEVCGCLPLEDLSLKQMASDALCVVKSAEEMRRKDDGAVGGIGIAAEPPLSFCVGGASMGGMVAQLLAGAAHGRVSLPCGRGHGGDVFELTSMALICTSSRVPSPSTHDFLNSFECWSSNSDDLVNRQCVERFFDMALGEAFLRRPGRARLREKLVDGFVLDRAASSNSCGTGMQAQKRALLQFSNVGGTAEFLPDIGEHIPSLVVHGKDDRVIHHKSALHLQHLLGSRTSLSLIEDCDHLCWITHGLELVEILGDFFSRSPVFLQRASDDSQQISTK
uniref:AB hydrolase-1 domain-containing protein n=1 Tax=Odontella aurita TaxID=265563 RepID=A0A7S4HNJ1_9STRA